MKGGIVCICFINYAFKTPNSWPRGVSALDALIHLAEKIVALSALYKKTNKNIMKYQINII